MTYNQGQNSLGQPVTSPNFVPLQSANLPVSTTSASVTFTIVPSTGPLVAKITNDGLAGCYLAAGNGAATAITSSTAPMPVLGSTIICSNCDYIGAGAILQQNYPQGTTTFAAISNSTTALEISVGYGT